MTAPVTTVLVWFDETSAAATTFTLDDPVRGVLDSATYLLGGDAGTDITGTVNLGSFTRGRTEQIFDDIDPASGSLQLNNEDRSYDPFNTAGAYYGNIRPGQRVQLSTLGVTTFEARIADWNLDYDVSGRSVAIVRLEDGLGLLGRQYFTEWTATASQTAGPRLTDILNRSEVAWSGGARDLDTGVSVLQGDLVTWGSNVLNYCQLVSKSDLGVFFCSRDGLITFRDRHGTLGATSTLSFADDGTGIDFQGIGTAFGSETFYTRVTVDREGGTAQSATAAVATDYGIRTLALGGLLQDSDSQTLDMANYLASIYSSGEARISSLTVNLNSEQLTEAEMVSILSLDLNDVVDVTWTPNTTGAPIAQSCIIQGIGYQIAPQWLEVTLSLGKHDQRFPFTLDDAVLGILDSAIPVLSF